MLLIVLFTVFSFSANALNVPDLVKRLEDRNNVSQRVSTKRINKILNDVPSFDYTENMINEKWEKFDCELSEFGKYCGQKGAFEVSWQLGNKTAYSRCIRDVKKAIATSSSFSDNPNINIGDLMKTLKEKQKNYNDGLDSIKGPDNQSFVLGAKSGYSSCIEDTKSDIVKSSLDGFGKVKKDKK